MAVTTRNRGSPAKPTAATKKAAAAATSKKAQKKVEPEPESEEDSEDQDEEPSKKDADSDDDEPTFKIHTPKAGAAASAPRITPAALPTMKYEDDSDDEDNSDDEAPEAESLSSAKAKIQSAQDKEKSFLSKVQAEQKAKRVEREQKLKEQKDQSKAKKKAPVPAPAPVSEPSTSTTAGGLPALLPMDMLEEVAQMDSQEESTKSTTNKRKHMRPEDFALMELEAELRAEALKRKRTEKKQKNIGPVTVKVLDKSQLAQGHAIPQTVVDFRQQHFYGSKIQRKDAVLNMSQKSTGAARKFNRK